MIGRQFQTLARHWVVLKESWKQQNEAQAKIRPRSDHEFLPAALEIMEKPPSPGLRWLLLSVCVLFSIALVWSFVGTIDVVATASGRIIPSGNVKVIQPIEIGYVRKIHVANGQHVEAGQLLVELDPTLTGADAAQASQGLRSAEVIAARNTALLSHVQGRGGIFNAPSGTPSQIASTQNNYVRMTIAEYEGERASLVQQRAERAAELTGAQAEVAKLRQTLPLVDQQLIVRQELAEKGYFSKIRLLEYEQLKIEHLQNIAVQEANASKARAAMANIDAQLVRLEGSFGRAAVTELAEAQEKLGLSKEEVTKSDRRKEFQLLRAPVSGTVQQLAVSTVGGVVQPAQAIMIIVPDDAVVVVEANILNKDIGFVREGQPVRIKLEAFNFTDYGIIPGIVESISRDAIDLSQQGQATARDSNGRPQPPGLVYATRIRLNKRSIRVRGRDRIIGPGLAAQAEIKTGERRIIDYLLSPIAQTLDEAGRER
ncbi:HlyD family type I secretion periplasmic adaptor subunit [Sphingorhabdus sp. IMCC26285]|uniref:Membrane fusion protein (MFP) family protein n=1 Tax=Sphingorhabdus profundilacus TaxID=2509718 RepID=A0A6I4LYC1_9SPHN|nr:HlyD family type I secretion periplasmic adaptor subunit [Sphingorhabdus profundilacus]MVZ98061.1 HlyD family type I secretion periplasmic adaptor subunit [Sphingorhabdus profundilacus]